MRNRIRALISVLSASQWRHLVGGWIKTITNTPRPICVGFVADKVVLGECFLRERPFSTVRFIPPMVRAPLCVYNRHCIILTVDCVAKKNPPPTRIPIQFFVGKVSNFGGAASRCSRNNWCVTWRQISWRQHSHLYLTEITTCFDSACGSLAGHWKTQALHYFGNFDLLEVDVIARARACVCVCVWRARSYTFLSRVIRFLRELCTM